MPSTVLDEESRSRCGNTKERLNTMRQAHCNRAERKCQMVPQYTVEFKRPYTTGVDMHHQDLEGIYQLILLASADGGAYELRITPEDEDD